MTYEKFLELKNNRMIRALIGIDRIFCLTHRIHAQSRDVVNKFVLLSAGLFNHKLSAKLTC